MTTTAAASTRRLATYTVAAGRRELVAHATAERTLRVEDRPAAGAGPTFTVEPALEAGQPTQGLVDDYLALVERLGHPPMAAWWL